MSRGAALAAAALLVLAFLSFFRGADRPGLLEKDEPRYAVPAREMVRSGDRLVPRFGGAPRLEKPPGTYWAQAAAFSATGRFDERSARLPSAIAATLAVLLVAAGAGRALGLRAGLAAGAALATMLHFVVVSRLATTDMLHALLFAATAAAWVPVLEGSPRAGGWILLSGLLAGLATLVKTPLALFLPPVAAAGTAFLLGRLGGPDAVPPAFRAGGRGRTALAWLGAAAIAAALFLAWFLPCDAATDGRLFRNLRGELAARADGDADLHSGPPWFFVGILLAGALPWTFLLPAGVASVVRAARASGPGRVLGLYAAVLAAVVFLFFSALPSKLPNYILPLAPALAVLVGYAVHDGLGAEAPRRWRLVAGWPTVALGVVLVLTCLLLPVVRPHGWLSMRTAVPAVQVQGVLLIAAGIAALAGRAGICATLAALSTTGLLLLAGPVTGTLDAQRCARTPAQSMLEAGLRPGDRVVDASNPVTGIAWYADLPVETRPGGRSFRAKDLPAVLASPERSWAVVKHDPEEARRENRETVWERVRDALPPGTRVRVVWEGWERVIVTNTE